MSLVIVGLGITLGKHLSERAHSEIDSADTVFALVDGLALAWLQKQRPDMISLHPFYQQGETRLQSYQLMRDRVMDAVKEGGRVCAVFYGHPAVFADVPHMLMKAADAANINARLDPGISADACLYADLGLDPGRRGVTGMEATQFLIFKRQIDPGSLLILWQVGVTGDLTLKRFDTEPNRLALLTEKLCQWYPNDHEVILYEANIYPIGECRADYIPLSELANQPTSQITTLVVPPLTEPLAVDHLWRQRLEAL
ncbi:SAM-dependent methyltransferase [Gallaecimonas mangrovi]|uniref:SAM-dependent methyltransferase n=1 Tax=Gallaecimonas mangrovi TaxID=2291597 RepID=UPI000E200230|nr:SAM-dependent methyltransferase [Gallaecimonas mangrovi]